MPVPPGEPRLVRAGDIDGDGLADLVAGYGADRILWWRGLGGGRFKAPELVSVGVDSLLALELVDLDVDGFSDLVAATRERLTVFRGSSGGLLPPVRSSSLSQGPSASRT